MCQHAPIPPELPQQSEPEALPDFLRSNGPGVLFSIGDRVRHKRFGTGAVVEISGTNVTVDFGSVGTKRVRSDFVRKAV